MADFSVKNTRTLCLVSHAGAGKTSLAEAMIFDAGMSTRLGSVMDGNTIPDYNSDEIERKISISAKLLNTKWKDNRIFIVDTPGYADFTGEVISAIRAVDSAIVLVDCVGGIEVGTDRVWEFLEEAKLPRMIFISKVDKENANFLNVLNDIKNRFGKKCVALQVPIGTASSYKGSANLADGGDFSACDADIKDAAPKLQQELIEVVSEADDALLEKFLEGAQLTKDEIKSGMRKGVLEGKIVPVFCGSATANLSVKELMDAIVDYMPSPAEMPKRIAKVVGSEEKKEIPNDENAPFSAFVFKSISDPYVGQMTLFRVFSGVLNSDTGFYNSTKDLKERIGQIYIMQGKEQVAVTSVKAGDIAALAKLKGSTTNDTLCDEKNKILFDNIIFPEAAISASVKPHSKHDEEKIMGALARLASEDPTFSHGRDPQTKELLISGMGDLHLEIMVARLKDRFKVGVDIGTPKVAYKETIKGTAKVQGKYKRQSGGRGQYGDCSIEVHPLEKGKGFEFVDKVVGGAIPRNFIPSVEKGIVDSMKAGILAGYPVVDMQVILFDGSFHPVDSSDMAFQIAGSMAFKKAQEQAKPILLEPIMDVETVVPDEFMGQITGDLNQRRGRIIGMELKGKMQGVKAHVPLSEMFKYASELRSMTGGQGSYTMRFSYYDEVPGKIAQTIVAQSQKGEQKEEE